MKNLSLFLILLLLISGCTGSSNEEKAEASDEVSQDTEVLQEAEEIPAALSINGTDEDIAAQISEQLVNVLLAEDIKFMTPEQRKFRYAVTDLNDDGNREYLVEFRNSYFCGSGGCTYLLLDSDFNEITTFTVSESPFIISEEKTSGWRNLIIPQGSSYHVIKFDGNVYPGNPSVAPEIVPDPERDRIRLLDDSSEEIPEFTF